MKHHERMYAYFLFSPYKKLPYHIIRDLSTCCIVLQYFYYDDAARCSPSTFPLSPPPDHHHHHHYYILKLLQHSKNNSAKPLHLYIDVVIVVSSTMLHCTCRAGKKKRPIFCTPPSPCAMSNNTQQATQLSRAMSRT